MESIIQKLIFWKTKIAFFFIFQILKYGFKFHFSLFLKFEFMEVDCDVEELSSDWLMLVLYYVWFYSMTSTLNDDSLTKMNHVGKE